MTVTVQMVRAARDGDQQAANRVCAIMYGPVDRVATRYFLPGADHNDVVQYGMEGVLSGIRSWRDGGSVMPWAFLLFCAERMIITGLKTHRRMKHAVLNESVSFDYTRWDMETGPVQLHEVIADTVDVHQQLEDLEDLRAVMDVWRFGLSPLEKESLAAAIRGDVYSGDKNRDNAIQRARRKMREAVAA